MCVIILSASFKKMQSSKQNISTQDNSWLTSSQNRLMVLCSCACGQKLECTILIMTVNDLYIVNLSGYVGMFKFTVRWVFHLLLPLVITFCVWCVMCDSSNYLSLLVSWRWPRMNLQSRSGNYKTIQLNALLLQPSNKTNCEPWWHANQLVTCGYV